MANFANITSKAVRTEHFLNNLEGKIFHILLNPYLGLRSGLGKVMIGNG